MIADCFFPTFPFIYCEIRYPDIFYIYNCLWKMCEQGFFKWLIPKGNKLDLMTQEISSSLLDLWNVLAQLQGIRQNNYWRREKAKLLSVIELPWILFKIRSNWLMHYLFSSLLIVPLSWKLIRSTKAEYWYKMNLTYVKTPMSQSVHDRYHYQLMAIQNP